LVKNNFLSTGADRRGPAQTGTDRRRPAQTGADRRGPAQTGADRLFSVTPKMAVRIQVFDSSLFTKEFIDGEIKWKTHLISGKSFFMFYV
jgi:hypothetical protein